MNQYVVCMDSYYVRDAQMFDPSGLSDGEMSNADIHSRAMEEHWHDMEPTPFIGIVKAENEDEACRVIAEQYRYDVRCLFATKIG